MIFPRHKGSLHIEHNMHKALYTSIEDFLDGSENAAYRREHFKDPKEMIPRCIATDSVWEIQWYPDTPVGFYIVLAPTFEEALEYALEIDAGLK